MTRHAFSACLLFAALTGCSDAARESAGLGEDRSVASSSEPRPGGTSEISASSVDAADELPPPSVSDSDWPWWRGPSLSGIAGPGSTPLRWSESQNIVWKAPVPGRGHSSPTIVGNRVFLQTGDAEAATQSVLCYARADGTQLWKTDVHQGNLVGPLHERNTWATPTVACDGERVFASFFNNQAVWLTALDLDGNQLWQTEVGKHVTDYGYAASPVIYKSFVIVEGDNHASGFIAALNRESGEIMWRTNRPLKDSYASPTVAHVAGRDQVFLSGCDLVAGYNPRTGEELWSIPTKLETSVCTMSFDNEYVYASGGYPGKATYCIKPDSPATIVWENKVQIYEPSMLLFDGHLYAVSKKGIAYCWNAKSGKEAWTGRLAGNYSASPVLSNGHIYISNEQGTTQVFEATPKGLNLVAENKLGDEIFPTLSIAGGQIFLRSASNASDERKETLYCIGER